MYYGHNVTSTVQKKEQCGYIELPTEEGKEPSKNIFLHINSKTPYKLLVEVERQD